MLDNKLTTTLQSYLAQPMEQRDLDEGALLLLRLNRNRWLHAQIVRKRNATKLDHELRKYLAIRLEGLTTEQVVTMEREVLPQAAESLAEGAPLISTDTDEQGTHRGRRADHASLPEEIQQLYDRNGEVFFKMKSLFETLKAMEDATACDRHELLKQLAELDTEYRANWEQYDNYVVSVQSAEKKKKKKP